MWSWGENESGPAELLLLRQLMAITTSSGRKGVSRILSYSSRVASSMFGIDLDGGVGRDLRSTKFGEVVRQTDRTVVQSVLGEPLTSRVDPPDMPTGFLRWWEEVVITFLNRFVLKLSM